MHTVPKTPWGQPMLNQKAEYIGRFMQIPRHPPNCLFSTLVLINMLSFSGSGSKGRNQRTFFGRLSEGSRSLSVATRKQGGHHTTDHLPQREYGGRMISSAVGFLAGCGISASALQRWFKWGWESISGTATVGEMMEGKRRSMVLSTGRMRRSTNRSGKTQRTLKRYPKTNV